MTDNFNFLGLPLVVQDLITNEIVHNSFPEDRIQLALTSKFCNELVQRAKPKKIIDQFWIWSFSSFTFIANSRKYSKTKEQFMEILRNCQIKQLQLTDDPDHSTGDFSEILDILSEAARFATKFDIIYLHHVHMDEVVGFYAKLKHLKFVKSRYAELILPYYPPKVKLINYRNSPGNFLEDLAKKSQDCPLSFFELGGGIALHECQEFLQTAKFSIGAEICILDVRAHLTYLGQNIFTLEMFPKNFTRIFIRQKFVGKNRRIKLKRSSGILSDIAFNVVSASNPNKSYFSGVLKNEPQMLINLENVDQNEIVIIKFVDDIVLKRFCRPIYSAKMLESAFPTANFITPEERVEKINNVLGTNIQLIHAEDFAQIVELFRKTH